MWYPFCVFLIVDMSLKGMCTHIQVGKKVVSKKKSKKQEVLVFIYLI